MIDPAFIQIGVGVLTAAGSAVTIGLGRMMLKKQRVTDNTLKQNHNEVKAMDYAIEKSLGNGYSGYRLERLNELMEADKAINK